MAYTQIKPDETTTSFASEVEVSVGVARGDGVELTVSYPSSSIVENRWTTLTFPDTFEYRWVDEGLDYDHELPGNLEFGLIRIAAEDSSALGRVAQATPGTVRERVLSHYRVFFDHIAALEVIAGPVQISTWISAAGSPRTETP